MNFIKYGIYLSLLFQIKSFFAQDSLDLHRCTTVEHEVYLQQKNPKRASNQQFESWIKPFAKKNSFKRSISTNTLTIPVVFHVVHNGSGVGIAPNITNEQIISQVTVLNNDFRKKENTPGYNSHPAGADTYIEFALANVDAKGNPTSGINRVYYDNDRWSKDEIENILKPQTYWDTNAFLNIWLVAFEDRTTLGYAQFPSASGLEGLSNEIGEASTDGVVINYAAIGSREIFPQGLYVNKAYDKGRTLTHEVGHWLGLRHIWGDANCGNDYCNDTPVAHAANKGCPNNIENCEKTGYEMVQNYMDYTDDACMNIFTNNQVDRMKSVLANAPARKNLSTSNKYLPIALLENDAEIIIQHQDPQLLNTCSLQPRKYYVVNRGTNIINTLDITYRFNNGNYKNISWNGKLTPQEWLLLDMPETGQENDSLHMKISKVNGQIDSRLTNNDDDASIIKLRQPETIPYDEIALELQLDDKGSETSWEFINSQGVVLYAGGPYQDYAPSLIQEIFAIDNQECYVFKIYDKGQNGLCCKQGEGYYTLGYNTENSIIREGNFGSASSKAFTVQVVEESFYLYENPVYDNLTFVFNKNLGNISNCVIYDSTGKRVLQTQAHKVVVNTIPVAHLPKGVYLLNLNTEKESKTVKFIKN